MGKQLSIRRRNALPMLLLTFLLKGGLNQIMFLDRLRLRDGGVCGGGLNSRLWVYPLFFSASWYGGAASWKTCSSEDISDSLLFTDSGMFFIMLGGWFDLLCTYRGVFVGFEYGLNLPLFKSRVTSRKLTTFLFASIVI